MLYKQRVADDCPVTSSLFWRESLFPSWSSSFLALTLPRYVVHLTKAAPPKDLTDV